GRCAGRRRTVGRRGAVAPCTVAYRTVAPCTVAYRTVAYRAVFRRTRRRAAAPTNRAVASSAPRTPTLDPDELHGDIYLVWVGALAPRRARPGVAPGGARRSVAGVRRRTRRAAQRHARNRRSDARRGGERSRRQYRDCRRGGHDGE